jgi:hypothetical protein
MGHGEVGCGNYCCCCLYRYFKKQEEEKALAEVRVDISTREGGGGRGYR